eukprot:TRINITY_DN26559_c0_g1_i1.p1 TRINITY_DN26559_c0_g1~~TRINITY_DN26559_c0_g1_i1.p1  ORF type:complete len:161 (-),score=7.17 TRINITY_DN26559_c0_g1_i1:39-521(-)
MCLSNYFFTVQVQVQKYSKNNQLSLVIFFKSTNKFMLLLTNYYGIYVFEQRCWTGNVFDRKSKTKVFGLKVVVLAKNLNILGILKKGCKSRKQKPHRVQYVRIFTQIKKLQLQQQVLKFCKKQEIENCSGNVVATFLFELFRNYNDVKFFTLFQTLQLQN